MINKTQQLLTALRTHGRLSSHELEAATGIPARRVGALLAMYVTKKQVSVTKAHGKPTFYECVDSLGVQIERSIRLLEANGYEVISPMR